MDETKNDKEQKKGKPRYETPKLIALKGPGTGEGTACSPGSGNFSCSPGNLAFDCLAGTSPF